MKAIFWSRECTLISFDYEFVKIGNGSLNEKVGGEELPVARISTSY